MILTRDRGNRMWGGEVVSGGGGGGVSSSQLAGMLIGYATETWVDEHYISIDFFSRLFQAHGTENGSEIDVMPNDMETTITSVESMFGFWTNLYISALGSNGAAPAGISLGMLTDVNISGTPSAGQVLTFDAATQKWVNGNGGASSIATLTDVTLTSLQNGQTLLYDSTTSKWYNSALKTINGQSLLGSGDISVGGGASGNYLPLTGGTLVGTLNIANNVVQINFRHDHSVYNSKVKYATYGEEALVFANKKAVTSYIFKCGLDLTDSFTDWRTITPSLQIKNQSVYINQLIDSGVTPSYNLYVNNNAYITDSLKVAGIDIGYNNEINCIDYSSFHLNYRSSGYISLCYGGGSVGIKKVSPSYELDVNGTVGANNISIQGNGRINLKGETTDYLYIGNSNNHGWVAIQDMCSSNGYQYWQITTNGNSVFANVLSNGYITALSDARKKDITGEAGVTVEQIAHAPAVQFLWKDKERRKDGQQVGTLAQYWRTVLPEVVMDKGGELSMQYGVAALVSAIVTARKVVDHERRITELEKENERLKEEISQLRLD